MTAARHRAARRPRRRGVLRLLGVVVALFASTAMTGIAWALWSDTLTNPSLQVASGSKVGISFGRVGLTPAYATGPASVLPQVVGLPEGTTLGNQSTLNIPLAVTMRADGNAGLTYSIALPTFATGTLFQRAQPLLFPLTATSEAQAASQCTLGARPPSQPPTTGIVGIAPGGDPSAPQGRAVDYWCLSFYHFDGGGFYNNTGSATGTSSTGVTVQGSDNWFAWVVSPGTYSLTHQVVLP